MIRLPDHVVDIEDKVAELLIAQGKLERTNLSRARRVLDGEQQQLRLALSKLGFAHERDIAAALAEVLDLPLVKREDYPDAAVLGDQVSPRFVREKNVLPIAADYHSVVLAMVDPLDRQVIDAVRFATSLAAVPKVAVPAELEAAIDRIYNANQQLEPQSPVEPLGSAIEGLDIDLQRLQDLASEAPVIRLVDRLVSRAVEERASDIHLEAQESGLRVRYRIDGELREEPPPPDHLRSAIVSRIKILARLNIAERRLPQDGRMRLSVRGAPVDLRVATIPAMHGESVVLRILDRQGVELDFAALGLKDDHLQRYLQILDRPHGVCLVTGPTGSGKTTTLYTSLLRLNTDRIKIFTVEDPIEYQLAGVNQVQVKPDIGLDFSDALRSILRHDPDIIMVGEIRDRDTAQIAVQAALTGHLVLSTVHTNSAASSVTRLLDMGVEDYLLASTLNGVSAQRLVRRLCPHCSAKELAPPELMDRLGIAADDGLTQLFVSRPVGCEHCGSSGFRGRVCIMETLIMSDEIRQLILRRVDAAQLHRLAVEQGMRSMRDHGLELVAAGVTSLEEILRVTSGH